MDDLDRKILALLAKNARMPVKEIAEKVALTSPAVSSRIHKLETDGIHVTGAYTFLIKVSCGSMPQLEHLILQFQKLGTTSTQIILSTPVNHGDLEAMML